MLGVDPSRGLAVAIHAPHLDFGNFQLVGGESAMRESISALSPGLRGNFYAAFRDSIRMHAAGLCRSALRSRDCKEQPSAVIAGLRDSAILRDIGFQP